MEQDYWTWMRRKLIERSHVQAPTTTYSDSWEEQAFAQDSAGVLGGCIWPPRSYSCSFCRREFRSAQALGGHMNVHRRDRARLKQSPNPNTSSEILQHNPLQNHCKSLANVSSLAYSKNHNSNPSSTIASPLSPSRLSVVSTRENCSDNNIFVSSCLSSTLVPEHRKRSAICDPHETSPNSFSIRVLTVSDSKIGDRNLKAQDISFLDKGDDQDFKLDSSLNLNLVLHRSSSTGSGGHGDEGNNPSKKRKIDASSLPFFLKPSSVGRHNFQSEAVGILTPSKIEELDLELRLGDRPQVK